MSKSDPAGVESTGTTPADSPRSYPDYWIGPFEEPSQYGGTTGHTFLRCRACDVEVLTTDHAHATHRRGCPHR